MAKAAFPHDMTLNRLKARRRFLRRSLRKARIRKVRFVATRRPRKRITQVNRFIRTKKQQLHLVEYEIKRRRRTLRELLRIKKSGFVFVNGKMVCGWIADELVKARKHGWRGQVISGYRTPAYSRSLCIAMCGRPACPGRCAGVNTNHAKGPHYPDGAIDVTDAYTLSRICREHNLRIKHTLVHDIPHHSHTGQ